MRTKIVKVVWQDIIQDASWDSHEKVACPKIESIGWLAFEDDSFLKIGSTKDENNNLSAILSIPKGCVLSCKKILNS
tara:strand:- start:59 stop:289 length:231 start_codon:yes stop_codon:yes gene_type:complete